MAIIADGPTEVADETGGTHVPQDQENAAPNDTESQSGNESDLAGNGENQEAGKEAGDVETQGGEPQPSTESNAPLDLNQLKTEIVDSIKEQLKPPEPPPQPITEEQWAQHEQTWGVPRTAIDQTIRIAVKLKSEMQEYVDSKFAALESDAAIGNLAKEPGFSDVGRLKEGIKEFLKDFDPKFHSNPQLLKKAAIYARGLSSQKDIRAVRNTDEKNRQVVNRLKTGKSEGASAPSQKGLTEIQRQAAELLKGGENEYRQLMKMKGKPIAV